jgi:hypothetical protein
MRTSCLEQHDNSRQRRNATWPHQAFAEEKEHPALPHLNGGALPPSGAAARDKDQIAPGSDVNPKLTSGGHQNPPSTPASKRPFEPR